MIWLRYLLEYMLCKEDAVTLACVSKSAVHLMKGMAVRTKSKDLCRNSPMLCDWVATGDIDPKHIAGEEQPADFLTKALATPSFSRCKERVGMRSSMTGTACQAQNIMQACLASITDTSRHHSQVSTVKTKELQHVEKAIKRLFTCFSCKGECCANVQESEQQW